MLWWLIMLICFSLNCIATRTPACPGFWSTSRLRRPERNGRVAIALLATCPDVCHNSTDMVDALLYSFYSKLQIPTMTPMYIAYHQRHIEGCRHYEHLLRTRLSRLPSCFMRVAGLADAFRRIAHVVEEEYVLMLEHDWFLPSSNHSLFDFISAMETDLSINQIRLHCMDNIRPVLGAGVEIVRAGVPLIVTGHFWSNNPSLVRREFLLHRLLKLIDFNQTGSDGIENQFIHHFSGNIGHVRKAWFTAGLTVYGHFGLPKTILHLDTHRHSCNIFEETRLSPEDKLYFERNYLK